jgi:hypothetical protein
MRFSLKDDDAPDPPFGQNVADDPEPQAEPEPKTAHVVREFPAWLLDDDYHHPHAASSSGPGPAPAGQGHHPDAASSGGPGPTPSGRPADLVVHGPAGFMPRPYRRPRARAAVPVPEGPPAVNMNLVNVKMRGFSCY